MTRAMIRCLGVLCLLPPALAGAGSFMVVPVKLNFDAQSKTEALRIRNTGSEKVTLQLDAKTWTQDTTGEDIYTDSKDVIFFPKIADIEKGDERIVRIGYQGPRVLPAEKTYRLFVEELPVTKPGELGLKFALRLGVPIFVAPLQKHEEWTIDGVALTGTMLKVTVKNSGNVHLLANKLTATGRDDSGNRVFSRSITGWYVLAGAARRFALDIARNECLHVRTLDVAVRVEKDIRTSTLHVERGMCTLETRGLDRR